MRVIAALVDLMIIRVIWKQLSSMSENTKATKFLGKTDQVEHEVGERYGEKYPKIETFECRE